PDRASVGPFFTPGWHPARGGGDAGVGALVAVGLPLASGRSRAGRRKESRIARLEETDGDQCIGLSACPREVRIQPRKGRCLGRSMATLGPAMGTLGPTYRLSHGMESLEPGALRRAVARPFPGRLSPGGPAASGVRTQSRSLRDGPDRSPLHRHQAFARSSPESSRTDPAPRRQAGGSGAGSAQPASIPDAELRVLGGEGLSLSGAGVGKRGKRLEARGGGELLLPPLHGSGGRRQPDPGGPAAGSFPTEGGRPRRTEASGGVRPAQKARRPGGDRGGAPPGSDLAGEGRAKGASGYADSASRTGGCTGMGASGEGGA